MAKIRRNSPCECGSGKKFKKCCGAPVSFIMPEGVAGLTRPEPLAVEPTFNEFVHEFGGQLVGDLISSQATKRENADYFFPDDDVIVELKTFEKDIFNTPEGIQRIIRIIEKHRDAGSVSGTEAFRWFMGQSPIPFEYRRDMLSLQRRSIETAVRKANKQIGSTKEFLNLPKARGLVLVANDGNYFTEPSDAVALITQVIQTHLLDSHIDGFVYFTLNTVAQAPQSRRELLYWVPLYRQEGDQLAESVNRLGARWGDFYASKIGQEVPNFSTEDVRILKSMKLVRPFET